jgi:hypothetical protein
MASGDRSPGRKAPWQEGQVATFLWLPKELRFLVDLYKTSRRMPTFTEAVRRLLETHPDLTHLAETLYNEGDDTSPRS